MVPVAPGADALLRWGCEYKKLSVGDVFDFSAGTSTLIVQELIQTTVTPYERKKLSVPFTLDTTGWQPDDIVLYRIFRDATTDTYGNAGLVFDIMAAYYSLLEDK